MKQTLQRIVIVPKRQAVRLSRFLRWLCLLALAGNLAATLFAVFLPLVNVERLYQQPPTKEHQNVLLEPSSSNGPKAFSEQGNRWFLQLAETSPAVQLFSFHPGPSLLIPDRAFIARTLAVLTLAYGTLGPLAFFRLFDSYSKGCVFELENVRRLKHIGWWLIGTYPVMLMYELSKTFWSTATSFNISPEGKFFMGLFIFMIAAIMNEATRMNEELAETI